MKTPHFAFLCKSITVFAMLTLCGCANAVFEEAGPIVQPTPSYITVLEGNHLVALGESSIAVFVDKHLRADPRWDSSRIQIYHTSNATVDTVAIPGSGAVLAMAASADGNELWVVRGSTLTVLSRQQGWLARSIVEIPNRRPTLADLYLDAQGAFLLAYSNDTYDVFEIEPATLRFTKRLVERAFKPRYNVVRVRRTDADGFLASVSQYTFVRAGGTARRMADTSRLLADVLNGKQGIALDAKHVSMFSLETGATIGARRIVEGEHRGYNLRIASSGDRFLVFVRQQGRLEGVRVYRSYDAYEMARLYLVDENIVDATILPATSNVVYTVTAYGALYRWNLP